MYLVLSVSTMFCLFSLNWARLQSCDVEQDSVEMCYRDKKGYTRPLAIKKLYLETQFYLRAVTEIDEDKNTISMQAELWSYWSDGGVGLCMNHCFWTVLFK